MFPILSGANIVDHRAANSESSSDLFVTGSEFGANVSDLANVIFRKLSSRVRFASNYFRVKADVVFVSPVYRAIPFLISYILFLCPGINMFWINTVPVSALVKGQREAVTECPVGKFASYPVRSVGVTTNSYCSIAAASARTGPQPAASSLSRLLDLTPKFIFFLLRQAWDFSGSNHCTAM